jgi:hypothetical protein
MQIVSKNENIQNKNENVQNNNRNFHRDFIFVMQPHKLVWYFAAYYSAYLFVFHVVLPHHFKVAFSLD